jgi:hypothetical protein
MSDSDDMRGRREPKSKVLDRRAFLTRGALAGAGVAGLAGRPAAAAGPENLPPNVTRPMACPPNLRPKWCGATLPG